MPFQNLKELQTDLTKLPIAPKTDRTGILSGATAGTGEAPQVPVTDRTGVFPSDTPNAPVTPPRADQAGIFGGDTAAPPQSAPPRANQTGVFADATASNAVRTAAPDAVMTDRGGVLGSDTMAALSSVPEQGTVSNQMSRILASDSPYLQDARQRAQRQAASRGLLNTSMAAGAGEQAAIQSALPIAQQDAESHMRSTLENQHAKNNLLLQQLQSATSLSAADAAAANQIRMQQMQIEATLSAQDADSQNKILLQKMQTGAQLSLADLDAATKILGIELNNESKERIQKIQTRSQLSLADLDAATKILGIELDNKTKETLQKIQTGAQLSIADLDAATRIMGVTLDNTTKIILQNLQSEERMSIADLDAATRIMGINLDNENKLRLQELVEDNKRALQSDASISTAFSNTMNSIGQAYQNPEMSATQQNAAAQYFMSSFKSYVEFQDVTGSSNYAEKFDWGTWDTESSERTLDPFGSEGKEGETRQLGGAEYKFEGGKWVDQTDPKNLRPFGERGVEVGEKRMNTEGGFPAEWTWNGEKWESKGINLVPRPGTGAGN